MRCLSCNAVLNDKEATRKYKESKEYLDLCDFCFDPIKTDVEVIDNPLNSNSLDVHEYEEFSDD